MVVSDYIKPELDYFRENCNFVDDELEVFELRRKGYSLEQIAEMKDYTYGGIKRISRKVSDKMARLERIKKGESL